MTDDAWPIIGVCAWLECVRWGAFEDRVAMVETSFVERLGATGAEVVVLPVQQAAPPKLVDSLDGILLVGGPDISAGQGKGEPGLSASTDVEERDRAEMAVAARALETGLPLLGVCRGCEILNVAAGGTLMAEVATQYRGIEHKRDRKSDAGPFEFTRHAVEANPGTPVHRAMGQRFEVSSSHHQAVDKLAPGFVPAARSPDGLIEAIYAPEHPFAVGVQWHPEADESEELFVALVEAATSSPRRIAIKRGATAG